MNATSADFTRRLDAVEARLRAHAERHEPRDALTSPDPSTGERWQEGQVWAHLAEFIPYWIGEGTDVIAHGSFEPRPFGRTKTDPGRIAAIERDHTTERSLLWGRVNTDIASLRSFLAGVSESAWSARGRHPTLGEMDLPGLVDEFLVGHLEQHADQLDELAG